MTPPLHYSEEREKKTKPIPPDWINNYLFGKKMKNRLRIFGILFAITTLLIWTVPMAVGYARAKTLQGSFFIANCACGHDIFYLIENGRAYDYCPGHKDKKLIGGVVVSDNQLVALRAKDNQPEFELKVDDGSYYLRYPILKDDDWDLVEQTTNPWRTTFRSYLPE